MMNDLKKMVNQHVKECAAIDKAEQKQKSSEFINVLFVNLKLIFPAWKQNFEDGKAYQATKELWLNTLIEESITSEDQISRGLRAAKLSTSAFFPSVGQFIEWTKKAAPRINEAMYHSVKLELPRHTKDEYKEFAKSGMEKIKKG